jgi:hypothetical protein
MPDNGKYKIFCVLETKTISTGPSQTRPLRPTVSGLLKIYGIFTCVLDFRKRNNNTTSQTVHGSINLYKGANKIFHGK